jgi:hypothetical protein
MANTKTEAGNLGAILRLSLAVVVGGVLAGAGLFVSAIQNLAYQNVPGFFELQAAERYTRALFAAFYPANQPLLGIAAAKGAVAGATLVALGFVARAWMRRPSISPGRGSSGGDGMSGPRF